MYYFTDPKNRSPKTSYLAESLLLTDRTGAAKHIEDLVPGFLTLSVEGREGVELESMTKEVESTDGLFDYGIRKKERYLILKYQVQGRKPRDFLEVFDRLKFILNEALKKSIRSDDGHLDLQFSDQPGVHYFCPLPEIGAPEAGNLMAQGEMNFLCPSPYKYSDLLESDAQIEQSFAMPWAREAELESVQATVTKQTDTFRLSTERGQAVVMTGTNGQTEEHFYYDGNKVFMDFKGRKIIVAGVDRTADIAYERSDFPDLKVFVGDKLLANPGKDLKIVYRVRAL